MAIPNVSSEALVAAMDQFDRELRDKIEWQDWEDKENYAFAIDREGKLYPVK